MISNGMICVIRGYKSSDGESTPSEWIGQRVIVQKSKLADWYWCIPIAPYNEYFASILELLEKGESLESIDCHVKELEIVSDSNNYGKEDDAD
jgi:hypothetical protein